MKRGNLIVLFALVAVFSCTGVSFSVWNSAVRLTDNGVHDYGAQISGNNIVWQTYDGATRLRGSAATI